MIVARVRRTVVERGLLPDGAHVLVGCSGGPDSAALLAALGDLAPQRQWRLQAASVDHGLRQDAVADVELARAQARQLGVPFHALSVQLEAGASVQARARDARYAALVALAVELGACRIAVGHTLDDQAETVLMRVLRGASVPGLAGVQPLRDDGVVRPLIDCRRADVHAFAARVFAATADDASNRNARFLRARVRHGLLDALRAEDPAIDGHLAALADDARDLRAHLVACGHALRGAAERPDGTLSIQALVGADRAVRREAIRTFLADRTGREPKRSQIQEVEALLRGRGEVLLGGGARVYPSADGACLHLASAGRGVQGGGLDAGRAGAKVLKQ